MDDIGGVVTRVGDETVGEMWSLYDGQNILNEVDPRFSTNIRNHIDRVLHQDLFHVSANTDPKGDRSKPPQAQDPDMLLHLVKETDAGIVVRGAKYETAAAYSNQAFVKPTIANWGNAELSDYAVGFICDLGSPGLKFICRTGFAGRAPAEDYPLSNRFDEIDALVIFDDVLIPWENVLFYRHTKSRHFYPLHTASLQRVRFRATESQGRGHADRRGALQRPSNRPRQAAGGAGKARATGLLSGRHQRSFDCGDRAGRAQSRWPVDAQSVICSTPAACWRARNCPR